MVGLYEGQLKLRDRSVNRPSAAAFDPLRSFPSLRSNRATAARAKS